MNNKEMLKEITKFKKGTFKDIKISYRGVNYLFEDPYINGTYEFTLSKFDEFECDNEIVDIYKFALVDDEIELFSFTLEQDDTDIIIDFEDDYLYIRLLDYTERFMVNVAYTTIILPR